MIQLVAVIAALQIATPDMRYPAAFHGPQTGSPFEAGETIVVAKAGRTGGKGVSGLPYAPPSQVFATLDDYVAYRARVSAMGGPTLREVAPGRFVEEFQGGQVNHYTREELLRTLGFER
ncbi:MAG: hypothetical protein KF723_00085 [Rhizobiaceae bacterium]|nr:hypothetical protein [Rhizobiaceae bacterium]